MNVLTRSSIIDSSEIQLWKTAQEEDPVIRGILQRWQQKRGIRGSYTLTAQRDTVPSEGWPKSDTGTNSTATESDAELS